ncbi:MAG: nucleotide exchange factor GrpE [Chloroflexota bacterium]
MVEENLNTSNTETTAQDVSSAIEALEKRVADEQSKAERFLVNWQRAQADFQNYQKRAERERVEMADSVRNAVLLALLPVVDEFELAVRSMPVESSTAEWVNGLHMIERKLKGFLDSYGITVIEALGMPFDPKYHEAVMRTEGEEGVIIQELRKGYLIRDAVLRPSLVVVGNGQKPETSTKDKRKLEKGTSREKNPDATKKEEDNG